MQYILMTLLASAMWGSWMQSTKHLDDFPMEGFILILYTTSLVVVWTALFFLKKTMIPDGLINEVTGKGLLMIVVIVCGGLMSYGLLINSTAMSNVGMILVTSISSVTSAILGLGISVVLGGLPSNISIFRVILALIIILGAGTACQLAGIRRDIDLGVEMKTALADRKYIVKVVIANILISFYVVGYSLGTKTPQNPNGFSPILCVALLATGSFISIFFTSIYKLKKSDSLHKLFDSKYKKQQLLGVISGAAHYGGNVLNILSTPALSAPVAFLLGKTSDFWAYTWGLVYGEFRGAKTVTKLLLVAGFILYVVGIVVLVLGLYN